MTADIDQPLALSTCRDPETQKRMTLKSSLPERASLTEKKKDLLHGIMNSHNFLTGKMKFRMGLFVLFLLTRVVRHSAGEI